MSLDHTQGAQGAEPDEPPGLVRRPIPPRLARFAFTPELARRAGLRSAQLRRERRAALAQRNACLLAPSPPTPPTNTPTLAPSVTQDPYTLDSLARTRLELDHLRTILERHLAGASPDPLAVERYSRAVSLLCEVERRLAGRPDPGRLAPTKAQGRPAPPPPPVWGDAPGPSNPA